VSKFFRALEKAERERAAAGAPPVPERTGEAEVPSAAPPIERPATPLVRARVTAPNGHEATAEAPPAPERPPAYGAPHARPRPARGHGFAWQVEADGDVEPGDVDDHLVSLLAPTSFAAEQYRAVRLAVETARQERGTRVVAVTSPGRGDGRTITAINLAGALAQSREARVVLVEADFRHPRMAEYLGLPPGRGLSGYLLDAAIPLDAVLVRTPAMAFFALPAGAASSMPYELLNAPRLAATLATLRDRFDVVVVDTPPALPFPDVGLLRDAVEGCVMVVRANRTPRELLRDALGTVGRARTLGVIFNDVPDGEPGWRGYLRAGGGARVA
jgi:protein-tyrosine kinase